MKRLVLAIIVLFTITISASAMSYAQAREQALFLTDKMAYELDLTDEQYEAAYEINLDYLMSINRYDDLYGAYWTQRNLDLSYILYDWQYRNYVDASYFYRPLYWNGGYWHFGVYARYPHRDYYFFGQPNIYVSYCGGHSWRMNGGRSWYYGRTFGNPNNHRGMRDSFNRGDYGRGTRFDGRDFQQHGGYNTGNRTFGNRTFDNNTRETSPLRDYRSFGNSRESSTRTTVTRPSNARPFEPDGSSPNRTFSPSAGNRSFGVGSRGGYDAPSAGNPPARSYSPAPGTRDFGGSAPSGGTFGGGHSIGRTFGNGGQFGRR